MKHTRHRVIAALALMLAATALSGCGCGPLGLRICDRHGGYYHGGYR